MGESKVDKIKALIKDYINEAEVAPGISIALMKKGKCIFKESYGYANLENKIKINSKSNFYLASVSKSFTAAAIMLLSEEGKLDVNEKISKYFLDIPEYCKDIRIINLINHTSGLKDYFGYYLEQNKMYGLSNKDVYNYVLEENCLQFPACTEFKYSNTGYTLLVMLIEKITKTTFSEFLTKNFFKPLGMNNTFVYTEDKSIIPNRVYGYREVDGNYYSDDYILLTTGDGGIYSCLDDLILWQQAFRTEKIFSSEVIEKIFTTENIADGKPVGYGYGWFIRQREKRKVVFHDGSAFGFRTFIGQSIDDDFSMIILTNCYKNMWQEIYNRASYLILELNDYYCGK